MITLLGKSSIVEQYAKEHGYDCKVVMLAQLAPADLSIPMIDKDTQRLTAAIIDWLKDLPETPFILFFDEIDKSQIDIRTAIYQLVLNRQYYTFKLPENTRIILAGNRPEDMASGFEIDTALSDRVCHFHMVADADQWLGWARDNGIHPSVLAFIKEKPNFLTDTDNFNDLVRRSPRSWERVSQYLHLLGRTPQQLYTMLAGRLGLDTTAIFLEYLQIYADLPNIETLFKASDAELKRLAPVTLTGYYGLIYTLDAHAKDVKSTIKAMKVAKVLCKDVHQSFNTQELLVMAMCLFCTTATKKGYLLQLNKDKTYRSDIYPIIKEMPDLDDLLLT